MLCLKRCFIMNTKKENSINTDRTQPFGAGVSHISGVNRWVKMLIISLMIIMQGRIPRFWL